MLAEVNENFPTFIRRGKMWFLSSLSSNAPPSALHKAFKVKISNLQLLISNGGKLNFTNISFKDECTESIFPTT